MRQANGIGNRTVVFYHLGTGADVQNFVLIDPSQSCLWLEESLLLILRSKRVFHDEVGFGEAFFDVSFADLVAGDHVIVTKNDRRPGCKRIERIVDAIEIFVFNIDEPQGLFGNGRIFRCHQRDGFTTEANPVLGQDRLLGVFGQATGLARHVGHNALAGG